MAEANFDGRDRSDAGARSWADRVYDPKVRSVVLQVALILFVFVSIYWIIQNTVQQLETLNKKSGFAFLFQESGFQILTTPGTWVVGFQAGESTYLEVFMLGVVNTITVSFLGIIAATFLGFMLGVFRLSSNFVLRGFSTVYVEIFRNTPLLLQLFIWYKAIVPFLPARRGEDPWTAFFGFMQIDRSGFWMYYPEALPGSWLLVAALVLAIAVTWALNAWAKARKARTGKDFPVLWVAVAFFVVSQVAVYNAASYATPDAAPAWYERDLRDKDRITEDPSGRFTFADGGSVTGVLECPHTWTREIQEPVLADGAPTGETTTRVVSDDIMVRVVTVDGFEDRDHIVLGRYHADRGAVRDFDFAAADGCVAPTTLAPIQWEPPTRARLGGFQAGYGAYIAAEMFAVWIALTLYTASFIAEIVRAGILAVNKGQREAASALGLRNGQTLNFVVIPQALRVIIPPLTSQFLNLTKNSSLAVAIAYPDVVSVFAGTALNQVGQEIEMIFMMMMVYLFLSITISIFMNWYNRRIALVER